MRSSLDRVLGFLLLGATGLMTVGSWKLVSGPAGFGGALPLGLSVLLGLLSLLLLADTFRTPKPDRGEPAPQHAAQRSGQSAQQTRAAVGLIAMLALYAAVFDFLGYLLTTAVFGLIYLRFLHGLGWRMSALTTTIMTGAGYLLFDRLLAITLPVGTLYSFF